MAGYFPMFCDLENKPVLVIGYNRKALEKAEKLATFKPHIVFVKEKVQEFKNLIFEISPAAVIVADTTLADVEKMYEFCVENHIAINTVDNKKMSTFIFPAVFCTENLTVAVSTNGKSPAAAVKIREKIGKIIPDSIDEILDWLGSLRSVLKDRKDVENKALPALYRELADEAFEKNRPLNTEETEEIVSKYRINSVF